MILFLFTFFARSHLFTLIIQVVFKLKFHPHQQQLASVCANKTLVIRVTILFIWVYFSTYICVCVKSAAR